VHTGSLVSQDSNGTLTIWRLRCIATEGYRQKTRPPKPAAWRRHRMLRMCRWRPERGPLVPKARGARVRSSQPSLRLFENVQLKRPGTQCTDRAPPAIPHPPTRAPMLTRMLSGKVGRLHPAATTTRSSLTSTLRSTSRNLGSSTPWATPSHEPRFPDRKEQEQGWGFDSL